MRRIRRDDTAILSADSAELSLGRSTSIGSEGPRNGDCLAEGLGHRTVFRPVEMLHILNPFDGE
jgi:hypothetical protein